MAKPGWYNQNAFRDYPFLTQTQPLNAAVTSSSSSVSSSASSASSVCVLTDLPHAIIVDFGAIMFAAANFDDLQHIIYLYEIRRCENLIVFEFRTTATDGDDESLVFVRDISDPENAIEWTDSIPLAEAAILPVCGSSSLSSSSVSSVSSSSSLSSSASSQSSSVAGLNICEDASKWQGFLVTGDISVITGLIADGESLTFSCFEWQVEPARMQTLAQAAIQTVNLANESRTHALPQPICSSMTDDTSYLINQVCMTGPLEFKEGYNCSIRQQESNNTLLISASLGAGAGLPCDEILLTSDERALYANLIGTSPYLTGGPGCGEILKTLNGYGPTDGGVAVASGPGVLINQNPITDNQLDICLDMSAFPGFCAPVVSSVSSSASSVDSSSSSVSSSVSSSSVSTPMSSSSSASSSIACSSCPVSWDAGSSVGELPLDVLMNEVSGMVASTLGGDNVGKLWVFEDGVGVGGNDIHAIDETGTYVQRYTLENITNQDFEDIATATVGGTTRLYIADSGDNTGTLPPNRNGGTGQTRPLIVRFPEPVVPAVPTATVLILEATIQLIEYDYPLDGVPDAEAGGIDGVNGRPRDAECIIVDPNTGHMYIITKRTATAQVFRLKHADEYFGPQLLEYIGENTSLTAALSSQTFHVTGGDCSPDGCELLIRLRDRIFHWCINYGVETFEEALLRSWDSEVVTYVEETQGEAIAFKPDKTGFYTTSEGSQAPIYRYLVT